MPNNQDIEVLEKILSELTEQNYKDENRMLTQALKINNYELAADFLLRIDLSDTSTLDTLKNAIQTIIREEKIKAFK